jgi:hypothetical protein
MQVLTTTPPPLPHRYALWTRERRQASSYGADGFGGFGGYGGVGGYAGPLALRSPARRGAAHDKWLLTMKERYGHSSSSSSLYGSGAGGAGGWGAYSGSEATSPYESSQRRTSLHSEATSPYESSQRRTSAVAGAEYSSSLSGKGTSRLCSPPPRTSLASGSSSTIPSTYRSPLGAQRMHANLSRWEAAPVTAPFSVSAGCTIRRAPAEAPAGAQDHERDLGRDYGRDRARSGRDYEVLGDGACSVGGGRATAPGAGGDGDGYGETATGAAPPPGRSARRSPTREEAMGQSGTLYARLVRATGLKSIDSDGQSDPYVRLSLGEWTHRSKTCKKTNDPVWEETFSFKGTLRELLAQPLQLQVMTDD